MSEHRSVTLKRKPKSIQKEEEEQAPIKKKTKTIRVKAASQAKTATSRSSASKKRSAAAKIVKFMRQSRHTRKAIYLATLCNDAGICLAFGEHADDIKKHFNGFTHFDYVTDKNPIKQIGQVSNNGFIKEITYIHRDYKAYAILKSSQTPVADNLMYEYLVGQYVNKLNKLYPCFLETYGYYIYKDEIAWEKMKTRNSLTVLKQQLILQNDINYDDACRWSQYLAILIQHLKGVKSLAEMARQRAFVNNDLLTSLFQIYMPLAMVKDTFTHYDLHMENIQIYEPKPGYYIHFHYYLPNGKVVSFKSSYIAKIIDYGRAYFNDVESGFNSEYIFAEVCEAEDCRDDPEDEEECGVHKGFTWMRDDEDEDHDPADTYYISSQKRNMSHDLLPLLRLKENNFTNVLPASDNVRKNLDSLFAGAEVKYEQVDDETAKDAGSYFFGTPEIKTKGLPASINNVQDAFMRLAAMIMMETMISVNDRAYADDSKLMGDLMIFSDGTPMSYSSIA